MSLTVAVFINGHPILARTCRNVRRVGDTDECEYKVDDGRRILHHQDDGATALAIKLLEGVEEP